MDLKFVICLAEVVRDLKFVCIKKTFFVCFLEDHMLDDEPDLI